MIGLSAIIRFDCLFYGFAIIALILLLGKRKLLALNNSKILKLFAGIIVGLSPWICFSLLNFGRIWASDNSWVALSSTYAYVDEFPAYSQETIFTNPLMWALRVGNNILPFMFIFVKTLSRSPITWWAIFLNILFWSQIKKKNRFIYIAALLLLGLCSLPYIATGYYHIQRYYSLPILMICIISMWQINEQKDISKSKFLKLSIIISILWTLLLSLKYCNRVSLYGLSQIEPIKQERVLIDSLAACHMEESQFTYVFDRQSSNINLYRYGAITGMKTATLPRNWSKLKETKTEYFKKMYPYKMINKEFGGECL